MDYGNGSMRVRGAFLSAPLGLVLAACAGVPPDVAVTVSGHASAPASVSALPSPPEPVLTVDTPRDPTQAPRWISGRLSSTVPLLSVTVAVPALTDLRCDAGARPGRQTWTYECGGLLPAALDVRIEITATTGQGVTARATSTFRTMGERLTGVPWFTEFEDPGGEALACAAASARIIETFTTGRDPATAAQILARGRPLNKSADPGIDPAAIAAVIQALEPGNRYHYYRFPTREQATLAAVYWLARSAKPVLALSLAGQHGPLITGYTGSLGATLADAANRVTGLVVEDPQRGDLDPATAKHRPDKSRSVEFQTGKLVGIDEWNGDDWWFRDAYNGSIVFNSDAKLHDVDRNDGVYPRPHWDGSFVILVDDGDSDNPPDREGMVRSG